MYKYHSIISNSDNDSEKKEIFNNLLSKQVDGIIFLGGTISDEIKDLLINHLFQSLYQVRMEKMTISLPLISISKLQQWKLLSN